MAFLNLARHCLVSLANSLFAEEIIPRDVLEETTSDSSNSSKRCLALFSCVEDKIGVVPSDFAKVVRILDCDSFFKELVKELIKSYGKLRVHLKAHN